MTVAGYHDFVASAREHPDRLVAVERGGQHAVVRLDDPGTLNALSAPLTL